VIFTLRFDFHIGRVEYVTRQGDAVRKAVDGGGWWLLLVSEVVVVEVDDGARIYILGSDGESEDGDISAFSLRPLLCRV
jgi:hypothetical protein